MKPLWEMTETEKVELATRIILRVAEKPDGMTTAEIQGDGEKIHSSVYFALCNQGWLEIDRSGQFVKFKIADGKLK